jgi:glycosyltransferase involved in cell wall biosynthesis
LLYIGIPAYNEAPTIGVLLWRIHRVLQDSSRPYEIIIYDDASTDSTREVLQPYEKVLPLTIMGEKERVGYAGALRALVLEAATRTRYPRRDALALMQGDFTDQPEHLAELVKRFEGGADIVIAERPENKLDAAGRSLARLARLTTRPFISVPDVVDPFGTLRLFRISVLRDLLKTDRDTLLTAHDRWAANAELLLRAMRVSNRSVTVTLEPRYDLRTRPSRLRPFKDALGLMKFGWQARKWQPARMRTS